MQVCLIYLLGFIKYIYDFQNVQFVNNWYHLCCLFLTFFIFLFYESSLSISCLFIQLFLCLGKLQGSGGRPGFGRGGGGYGAGPTSSME